MEVVEARRIGRLLVALASVAIASGQSKPDPGGWHGTRWGMTEAEVRGIFQDKLKLCSGWPPPLEPPAVLLLTVPGVDCFVLDGQQTGSHRYSVTFCFFASGGGPLEQAINVAEDYQRQSVELGKMMSYALPGSEPPPEVPKPPAAIKLGKKLALIEFFAQDVDDQIGVFHDLHADLVNSYGQPTDKTDESDDSRIISRERWLIGGTEIRLDLSFFRDWPTSGPYRGAYLEYRVRPSGRF